MVLQQEELVHLLYGPLSACDDVSSSNAAQDEVPRRCMGVCQSSALMIQSLR